MKVIDTKLDGVKIVQLTKHGDKRGFFVERFNEAKFKEAGLPIRFAQDNHSRSSPGVLRGLHFQHTPPQGKLVGAVRGRIWDVAVDVRPNSKTFGEYVGVELSDENATLLWVPGGFAHGFCVLGDEMADVMYKVTETYNAPGEMGILYDDPDLNIPWPIKNPVVSDRDTKLQSFAQYKKNPVKW
ncbi:MAG: dTDP-4-dehydrorhamnose 3,5-epimerase [Proteobacteria bacterium]|nr:dTDP-4-dehydrorhamnose 3,5-epimerase [Pseudomonadota bacterium]